MRVLPEKETPASYGSFIWKPPIFVQNQRQNHQNRENDRADKCRTKIFTEYARKRPDKGRACTASDVSRKRQHSDPDSRHRMCNHNGRTVTDPIDKTGGSRVHKKLYSEIERCQKCDFLQTDPERGLKGQEKQRSKIVDDRLYDIPCKTGVNRSARRKFSVH